eukprot:2083077-Rhodomonas_salina.1
MACQTPHPPFLFPYLPHPTSSNPPRPRRADLVEERAGGELLLGVEVARDRVALLCARAGVVDDAQERVEGVRGHQRLNLCPDARAQLSARETKKRAHKDES